MQVFPYLPHRGGSSRLESNVSVWLWHDESVAMECRKSNFNDAFERWMSARRILKRNVSVGQEKPACYY